MAMAPKPKKALLKKPTGESSKQTSEFAKSLGGVKRFNLTPTEARTAAGKYRDLAKNIRGENLDAMGLAIGKAVAFAKNPPAKKIK